MALNSLTTNLRLVDDIVEHTIIVPVTEVLFVDALCCCKANIVFSGQRTQYLEPMVPILIVRVHHWHICPVELPEIEI